MNVRVLTVLLSVCLVPVSVAMADQVIFKNGDKITGKLGAMEGGKLKITSAVAGEITVDMKDVATFSTDEPIEVRTSDGKKIHEQITAGETDQIKPEQGEVIPLANVTKLNPPPQKWTGSILVNGAIQRGNTNTDDLGISINAVLRRETDTTDDRFTLDGGYFFGRSKSTGGGDKVTTTDNWNASFKYDRFWTKQFYTYGIMKAEHDRIAALNYRLSPGVGVGYQWIERPDLNFNTEAGISYVYEDYTTGDSDDHIAGRLAYHFDKKLNDVVTLFHNLEWLPAFEDPSDYNLDTDAGIRVKLTKAFFTEFKAEWKRDSTPAPGAEKNDLRYILGVGWQF